MKRVIIATSVRAGKEDSINAYEARLWSMDFSKLYPGWAVKLVNTIPEGPEGDVSVNFAITPPSHYSDVLENIAYTFVVPREPDERDTYDIIKDELRSFIDALSVDLISACERIQDSLSDAGLYCQFVISGASKNYSILITFYDFSDGRADVKIGLNYDDVFKDEDYLYETLDSKIS